MDAEQRGSLRSDEAVVDFRDNHIARATVTGKPAEFEQKRSDSQQVARGHADEIVYDVNDGTRASVERCLAVGRAERDLRTARWSTTSAPSTCRRRRTPGSEQRVHIIIQPGQLGARRTHTRRSPQP